MEFICYTDWNRLPDSVDALFAQAAKDSIFFSRPWFDSLIKNAPDDGQNILLACVVDNSQVLAMLPLKMRSSEHWYSLTNLYSSLYSLLLTENQQQELIECLAQGLSRLPFSSLRLEPISEDDRNLQGFQQTMESLGISCQRKFRFYNWVHHTKGQSFHQYMAARPARVRNTITRKERKLSREYGYTTRLFTDNELPQALADYNAVYRKSWKANELYNDFIKDLAGNLSAAGCLRIAILYIHGMPVAAQFWFVAHGKASIFKLVYDEDWKQYSPGSILTAYLMEHVIDTDKVQEIDFLTGNDAYKQDWMSERRERWSLYCINKPKPERRITRFSTWLKRIVTV